MGVNRIQLAQFVEMLKDFQGFRVEDPQSGTAALKFAIEGAGTIQFPVKVDLGGIRLLQALRFDKEECQQVLPGQSRRIDGLGKGRMVAKAQIALEPDDFSSHGMIL